MRGKIYTRHELESALPLVRAITEDVVRGYRRLHDELRSLGAESKGDSLTDRDLLRALPWDVRDLVDEIRSWIDELAELGLFLRDPKAGLVEAYGDKDGMIVYFSWKPGEDRVRFWHGLFGSPRERRPVHAMA